MSANNNELISLRAVMWTINRLMFTADSKALKGCYCDIMHGFAYALTCLEGNEVKELAALGLSTSRLNAGRILL